MEIPYIIESSYEAMKLRGWFELVVRDADGNIKDYRLVNNTVVNVGKAQVAGLINSALSASSGGAFKYLAIGTATSATGVTDTTLGAEATTTGGGQRGLATTLDRVTTSVTNDTARFIKTFSITSGTLAAGEAAIFDASSGGEMLARQPYAVINLSSGDSLQTTWQVQVS